MRTGPIQRIIELLESIEQLFHAILEAISDSGPGGTDNYVPEAEAVASGTQPGAPQHPAFQVNLGWQTSPESLLPTDQGWVGTVRAYQRGASVVVDASSTSVTLTSFFGGEPAQVLVGDGIADGGGYQWVDVNEANPYTILPGTSVILRHVPPPNEGGSEGG